MIHRNEPALNHILAQLATEGVGADTDSILVMAFLNEWKRTPKAYEKHFIKTDGAGATASWMFWQTRRYLYPKEYAQFKMEEDAKKAKKRKKLLPFLIERQKKDRKLFESIKVGTSVFKYPGLIAKNKVRYSIRIENGPYQLAFGLTPEFPEENANGLTRFIIEFDESGVINTKKMAEYRW